MEDFLVSNILLPAGSLVFLFFCLTKAGWGPDKYLEEANKGEGLRLPPKVLPYLKYVLPVLIIIIFVNGLR